MTYVWPLYGEQVVSNPLWMVMLRDSDRKKVRTITRRSISLRSDIKKKKNYMLKINNRELLHIHG